jgi:hypothetical protein
VPSITHPVMETVLTEPIRIDRSLEERNRKPEIATSAVGASMRKGVSPPVIVACVSLRSKCSRIGRFG